MTRANTVGAAFVCALILFSTPLSGATYTSTQSGDWNQATTWGLSGVPASGDDVTITSNHVVTVSDARVASSVTLDGTAGNKMLVVDATGSLTLEKAIHPALAVSAASPGSQNIVRISGGALETANAGLQIDGGFASASRVEFTTGGGTLRLAGDLSFSGSTANAVVDLGVLAATLEIGGDLGAGGTLLQSTASTTLFNGIGAQTINSYGFGNVTVNKAGGVATLNGNVTIAGALAVSAGTLDLGVYEVGLTGGLTSLGSLNAASGSIRLNGTSPQTWSSASTITLGTLHIDNATGVTISGGAVVNGALTLNGGLLTVSGPFTVDVLAAVTYNSGWIAGPLTMGLNPAPARTFPVGTAAAYLPVHVDAGAAGTVTIEAMEGKLPWRTASNVLDRYWRVVAPSTATPLDTIVFNWSASDVTAGSESSYELAQHDGLAFTRHGLVNAVSHSATVTNISAYLGDWSVGQPGSLGAASTLAITAVNGGLDPSVSVPFDVAVEAQDDDGDPAAVAADTAVSLSIAAGTGTLGGTTATTIVAGASSATVAGVTYSPAESGVQLVAASTGGDALASGTSAAFNVVSPTLIVVNTNDSGSGSLRQALLDAAGGACATPCTIAFDIPGAPSVIVPASELPAVAGSTTVDATTDPDYAGTPVVRIDATGRTRGLLLASTQSGVRGLSIGGATVGVEITGDANFVESSFVGITEGGVPAANATGVLVTGNGNTIGGTTAAQANTIASNSTAGVTVAGSASGNRILGNSIYANVGAGIDLDADGATANDEGDPDSGPNGLQNYPFVAAADLLGGGDVRVTFSLDSSAAGTPIGSVLLEVFEGDPGEARTFLARRCEVGSAFDSGFTLNAPGVVAGDRVVMTATSFADVACSSIAGGTSEISEAAIAANCAPPPVAISGPTAAFGSARLDAGAGFASYLWSTGETTQAITVTTSGTYGVTVTNAVGCSATDTHDFTLGEITGPASACGSAILDAGAGYGAYLWSTGEQTRTITVTESGTYRVDVNDSDGRPAGSDTHAVTILEVPVVAIAGPAEACDSAVLDAGPGFASYLWSTGEITQTITVASSGTYGVTVTAANGCSAGDTHDVVMKFSTPVTITGPAQRFGTATLDAGPGFTSYLWSTGETTQSITVGASGTYSVTVTAANGCPSTDTHDVIVQTITGPAEACDSALLDAGSGYVYYVWSTGATTQAVTVTASGTYSVTVTDENGRQYSDTHDVVVHAATPVVIAGPSSACDSALLDAGAGFASYLWSTGETTQTITVTAGGTYSVDVVDGNGCSASDSHSVTINPLPVPVISGPAEACDSALLDAGAGFASYLWSTGETTRTITVTASGTYSATVTDGNGCSGIDTHDVTINVAAPVVIAGPSSACESALLDAGAAYASWLWSTGETTQTITVTAGGTYSVTATDANGCTASDSHDVTINAAPVVAISGPAVACESALLDAGAGFASYLWSTGETTQSITVTASGLYEVTVTDGNGCTGTGKHDVTINVAPPLTITGASVACDSTLLDAGAGYASYLWSTGETTQTITVTASGTYGVTATDGNGCTAGDTHDVTINAAAPVAISGPSRACDSALLDAGAGYASYLWSTGETTQTITVTTSGTVSVTATDANGCTAFDVHEITIDVAPPVVIAGPASACDGATLDAGSGWASYLWSTGEITQTIAVGASGTYSVTVTDGNGCSASDTHDVVINAAAPVISGPATACDSAFLDAGAGFVSYLWSTGETTRTITVSTSGTYSVTVTDGSGCSGSDSHDVTINAAPPVVISGPATACDSALLDAGPGYAGYLWSTGETTQTITVSTSGTYGVTATDANGCTANDTHDMVINVAAPVVITGPATTCDSAVLDAGSGYAGYLWSTGETTQAITVTTSGTYGVTATDANGCTAVDTHDVTINVAAPVVITGPATACDSAVLDAGPGYAGYLWSTGETTQTIAVSTSGTYGVTATDANGCTANDTHDVVINVAAPVAISGPATACDSAVLDAGSGYAGYLWSTGETTQTITVTTGGTYSVTATDANGCTTVDTHDVTINVAAPVAISGPAAACDSAVLDAGSGYAGYLWSTGETTQTITVATGGTYSVTATDANGCTTADTHDVVINVAAPVVISGPATACDSAVLDAGSGYAGYLWSTGETTQTITVTTGGTYGVTATDANGCTTADTHDVVINVAAPVIISGPATACDSAVLDAGSGYAGYLWSTGETTQTITVTTGGTYGVTATDANGCAASDTHDITIDVPTASITAGGPTLFCAGGSVTLSANPGASWLWSTGETTQSITASTSGSYSVTVTSAAGCSATSAPQTVAVEALPLPSIAGPSSTCAGAAVVLDAGSGFATYLWSTGETTQAITVSTAGTYDVTVTNAAGCSATDTHDVAVVENPIATIAAPASICANSSGSASVDVQPGATYAWTISGGTFSGGVDGNSVAFDAGASGEVVLGLTVTIGACSSSGTARVAIDDIPAAVISGPSAVCPDEVFTLEATPGMASYLWSTGEVTPSIVVTQSVASATYDVTITNASGCSATAAHVVTLSPAPSAAISAPLAAEAESSGLAASVPLQGGATYVWTIANGSITSGQGTPAITFSVGLAGFARLEAVVTLGSCSTTAFHDVRIDPIAPLPCPAATPVALAPAGATVTSPVTFSWNGADEFTQYQVWVESAGGALLVGTSTTHSLTAALSPGTYEWFVIGDSRPGCEPLTSGRVGFTVIAAEPCDDVFPAALLSPADGSALNGGEVAFAWTAVPRALEYQLWLSLEGGTPIMVGTTTTTSLVATAGAGESEWFIRTLVDGCAPVDSAPARFTVTPPDECLDNVRPDAISPVSGGRITSPADFTWTMPAGATSFDLYVIEGEDEPRLAGTTSGFELENVVLRTGALRWFVRAHFPGCGPLDSAEQSLEVVALPEACSTPGSPRIAAVGLVSHGVTFPIAWTDVPGATAYELELADDASFANPERVRVAGTVHQVTAANGGTELTPLFARVRAVDGRCPAGAVTGQYGETVAIYVLPLVSREAAVPAGAGTVAHRLALGRELAGRAFVVEWTAPWLTVVPASGIVGPEGTFLTITFDAAAVPLGTSLAAVRVVLGPAALSSAESADGSAPLFSIHRNMPVTRMPAGVPGADALIIPAVAHAPGLNATFRSDVRVTNTSPRLMQYELWFVPSGGEGFTAARRVRLPVEAGQTVALDDVLRTWFGTGDTSAGGTLRVSTATPASIAAPDRVTFASSRTFNASAHGTYGQFIPAIPFAEFIGREGSLLSLQQVAHNAAWRTNLGLVEGAGHAVTLLVKVIDADGVTRAEIPVDLRAGEHRQLNGFLASNGAAALDDGRLEISVTGGSGRITAYASVIDNSTSDPMLVTPVTLPNEPATKWIVPGVADLDNGTANWQTSLRVFNAGDEPAEVTFTFHPQNAGVPLTTTRTIAAGRVAAFDRALRALFDATNSGGALHLTTKTPARLVATARTYNQTGSGTYGQFISGVTESETTSLGERPLQLLQVEESARFRSNIGLAETSGHPVRLELTIIPPDAKQSATIGLTLAANEFRQLTSILRSAGMEDTYNARVTVRVAEGGGSVTAYASVIDQLTNDPTFVPGQ